MFVSADSRSVERLVVELVVSSLPRCDRALFRAACCLEYAEVEVDVVAIVMAAEEQSVCIYTALSSSWRDDWSW